MALVPFVWAGYYRRLFELACDVEAAADALHTLITSCERAGETARLIGEIERKADALTDELLSHVERRSLAHPRDELRTVARALDDVIDAIEAAADAFDLYGIAQPTGPAMELIELAADCAARVPEVVAVLRDSHRRVQRLAALRPLRAEITRLENLSDKVHREATGALFRQDDATLMLKWKQIYDSLEQISDRCDDVGDAVQLAALRHA
jgi:uncharacterized protein Yka (UPF0111/DUF47 family)